MSDLGLRVLVVSLSEKDSLSCQKILATARIATKICGDTQEMYRALVEGCGALVIAKEILNSSTIHEINMIVAKQGKWSFIPIIVLVGGGDLTRNNEEALQLLKPLRNTTLLERPVRVTTFISVVQAALADRKRQYEVRDLVRELVQSKTAAVAASRAKSDFLANMSHEIRTPLGAILGFSELLLEENVGPTEKNNYLQTMKRNGQLLSTLISDVLDLSKVESGKVDVEYMNINLRELISEIISGHQNEFGKKGIQILAQFNIAIPQIVRTDPLRLKQVINNVVGNALKFTDRGKIEIFVDVKRIQDKTQLVIEISDSGIGMSEEQIERLFQPFTQADSSITRKFGGTGLGLTLSKKLAQLLGGDLILLESYPGTGSKFEITIDVSQPIQAEIPTTPSMLIEDGMDDSPLEGCNVLLVEDSLDNQILISHLLRLSGANVQIASDGMDGIKKATETDFDVVLMDIQMPRLDGYKAIQQLRRRGYEKPIVALTAYAMKDDIHRCFEAGCDYHLTKPIHRQKLIQTISRCRQSSVSQRLTHMPKSAS